MQREMRKRTAAAAAWAVIVALVPAPAFAQAPTLQDLAKAAALGLPQAADLHRPRDRHARPRPTQRQGSGGPRRQNCWGRLARGIEVRAAAGKPYVDDTSFDDQVMVPGFIAQHDHPLLAALTMTSEIIAIEDWVLPQGTSPAAKDHADYIEAHRGRSAAQGPASRLLTWGYHQYFHGALKKLELDAIIAARPIIVWHRSAHEFYLNSAAERHFGMTKAWFDALYRRPEEAVGLCERALLGAGLVRHRCPRSRPGWRHLTAFAQA